MPTDPTTTPASEYVSSDGNCFCLCTDDSFHFKATSPKGLNIILNCAPDDAPTELAALLDKHDPKRLSYLCLYTFTCSKLARDRMKARRLANPNEDRSRCTCGCLLSTRRNGMTFCHRCDLRLAEATGLL